MAKQNKKLIIYAIVGIVILLFLFQANGPSETTNPIKNIIDKILSFGGGGSGTSLPVNKGVGMKVNIVDENGKFQKDLIGPNSNTFSIISATSPSGFISLSSPSCTSSNSACTKTSDCPAEQNCISSQCKCSFLSISSSFDNTAGDSDITINSASATLTCAAGNLDSNCGSLPNSFGVASITNTKRGNMNSKFTLPTLILKGASSSTINSDPISLDEVANTLTTNGLVDFKITADGTYKDTFGNDQPLGSKSGSFQIRAVKSVCADNTPVDYDNSDPDTSNYCSTAQKGKYCRVNTITGYPVYTDRASLCVCNSGYEPSGQVCKATACTPNTCISGTVNYCLSDGKSFETRCQQCGVANCPPDAYGASATSCNPATSGVTSQCVYPSVGGTGLNILLSAPSITTVPQCGDGVKNGAEQCDTNDFGGQSCSTVGSFSGGTLTCSGSCTYVTSACTSAYVKFRTLFKDINSGINVDGIAWNTNYASTCNSGPLNKTGEISVSYGTSQTCTGYLGGIGFLKMFNITNGITSITKGSYVGVNNFALWYKSSAGYYVVAGSTSSGGCAAVVFTTGTSTSISTSANTVDSSKETTC